MSPFWIGFCIGIGVGVVLSFIVVVVIHDINVSAKLRMWREFEEKIKREENIKVGLVPTPKVDKILERIRKDVLEGNPITVGKSIPLYCDCLSQEECDSRPDCEMKKEKKDASSDS